MSYKYSLLSNQFNSIRSIKKNWQRLTEVLSVARIYLSFHRLKNMRQKNILLHIKICTKMKIVILRCKR